MMTPWTTTASKLSYEEAVEALARFGVALVGDTFDADGLRLEQLPAAVHYLAAGPSNYCALPSMRRVFRLTSRRSRGREG